MQIIRATDQPDSKYICAKSKIAVMLKHRLPGTAIKRRVGKNMQYWFYLSIAIVLEVAGTTSMKISDGFTKIIPSILMFIFYLASLAVLTMALKKLDVSMAYAVWAGLGTALIAIIGIFYFHESATFLKMVSILLIIAGVVGLNLSGAKH